MPNSAKATDLLTQKTKTKMKKQEESKQCFAWFNKPISKLTDEELIGWYTAFLNGADPNDEQDISDYYEFKDELLNRSVEVNYQIEYFDSVL